MLQNQRNHCLQLQFYKHRFLISVLLIMILNKNDIKYLCVFNMFNSIIKIYLKQYMAVYMVYMDLVLRPVDAIC